MSHTVLLMHDGQQQDSCFATKCPFVAECRASEVLGDEQGLTVLRRQLCGCGMRARKV